MSFLTPVRRSSTPVFSSPSTSSLPTGVSPGRHRDWLEGRRSGLISSPSSVASTPLSSASSSLPAGVSPGRHREWLEGRRSGLVSPVSPYDTVTPQNKVRPARRVAGRTNLADYRDVVFDWRDLTCCLAHRDPSQRRWELASFSSLLKEEGIPSSFLPADDPSHPNTLRVGSAAAMHRLLCKMGGRAVPVVGDPKRTADVTPSVRRVDGMRIRDFTNAMVDSCHLTCTLFATDADSLRASVNVLAELLHREGIPHKTLPEEDLLHESTLLLSTPAAMRRLICKLPPGKQVLRRE